MIVKLVPDIADIPMEAQEELLSRHRAEWLSVEPTGMPRDYDVLANRMGRHGDERWCLIVGTFTDCRARRAKWVFSKTSTRNAGWGPYDDELPYADGST